jgi:hypothetical protein
MSVRLPFSLLPRISALTVRHVFKIHYGKLLLQVVGKFRFFAALNHKNPALP